MKNEIEKKRDLRELVYEGKKERFIPIKGFEDRYEISSFGRVRSLNYYQETNSGSLAFHKGIILKLKKDKDGYFVVGLNRFGEHNNRKPYRINRLVAMNFITDNRNKKFLCVHHKDNNKKNNFVENLEWVTNLENIRYKLISGKQTKGEQVNTNKLKETEVLEILNCEYRDGRKKKIEGTFSQVELAEKYGVTPTNIRSIINKETWKHLK